MVGVLADSDSEDELPPGWEERIVLNGNVYYVKLDQSTLILYHLYPRCLAFNYRQRLRNVYSIHLFPPATLPRVLNGLILVQDE